MLDITNIRIDGGTQSRLELVESVVAEYADNLAAGESLPPVITFFDGVDHWLADGFHRFFAHKKLGVLEISAEIREGTKRDAILFSVGANGKHGLRRTNADKRKAVGTLLMDTEWSQWSDNAIAKACGVSDKTVAAHRTSIFGNSVDAQPATRTVERNGKTYEQKTTNIGKQSEPAPKPTPAPEPEREQEPAPEQEPEYGELDAARDQISDLQRDLVVALMGNVPEDQKTQAASKIDELNAEIKSLSAQLYAVTKSLEAYMNENAAMKNQMAVQRRELQKLRPKA